MLTTQMTSMAYRISAQALAVHRLPPNCKNIIIKKNTKAGKIPLNHHLVDVNNNVEAVRYNFTERTANTGSFVYHSLRNIHTLPCAKWSNVM